MIVILEILLSGLSQPQYYEWTIITNVLDAVIVGLAIGIASLIIRITIMHRKNTKNIESNTYELVSSINELTNSFHNQLSLKHIKHLENHLIHVTQFGNNHKSIQLTLSKDILNVIHENVIYLLMKPVYNSLTLNTFFAHSHKINWNEFKKMSQYNYCMIFEKFPHARKKYIKSHPEFLICYNTYRRLKGDN